MLCRDAQAKGKELLALTDKLHSAEAEAGKLCRQVSSLQAQLEASQAKAAQQAAALASAQESVAALQVGSMCFSTQRPWCDSLRTLPLNLNWCCRHEVGHLQSMPACSTPGCTQNSPTHRMPCCVGLQAQLSELSRTCSSKEAECRQLQERSQEQQQRLAETASAAEQHATEFAALQVNTQTVVPHSRLVCA